MRAVIQRVASASVTGEASDFKALVIFLIILIVDGDVISKISKGLMVLVGIGTGPYILWVLI